MVFLNSWKILAILIFAKEPILLQNQKEPTKGVPRKRCSENMQQIYSRTLMLKCDFNKVARQPTESALGGCFCKIYLLQVSDFTKNELSVDSVTAFLTLNFTTLL